MAAPNFIDKLKALASRLGLYESLAIIYLRSFALRHGFGLEFDRAQAKIRVVSGQRVIRLSYAHYFYAHDIMAFFDYYFDAVVPVIEGTSCVVDFSVPRKHIMRRSRLPFYYSSLCEPEATNDIYMQYAALTAGATAFDLGAYCGFSTYHFSKAVGATGRVVAYEPDDRNYAALLRNIEDHALTNVTAVHRGVWSGRTVLSFQSEGSMGSSVSGLYNRYSATRMLEVVPLGEAFSDSGCTRWISSKWISKVLSLR